jgi:hypothetical protein
MSEWTPIAKELPPDGEIVNTIISDGNGLRNEQLLRRKANLWWFPDDSMYVYYCPTHWKTADEAAKRAVKQRAIDAARANLERAEAL